MIKAKKLPSIKHLSECLDYNEHSGDFIWKARPITHFKNKHGMNTFNSKFAGEIAGGKDRRGYVFILINGEKFLAHRLAWKIMMNADPSTNIDHVDMNKSNNAWENLREANHQQNAFNTSLSRKNKTGYKGVSFDKSRGKFYASIRVNGKTKSLGRHETAQMAYEAYCAAANSVFGEFSPLNQKVIA